MRRRPLRTLALAGAFVALAVLVWTSWPAFVRPGTDGPITNPTDFRAFYCAGQALLQRADPYLVEPLRSCELRAAAGAGLHLKPGLVLPAPHPPYTQTFFALFALMPFRAATIVWLGCLLAATLGTMIAVSRLSKLHLWVVAASTFTALGYGSLVIGQVMPLVLLALCGAALALRRRNPWIAAPLLGFAMIEPHLALPALVAAFVAFRWMRGGIAVVVAALAILSLLAVGPATVAQYFRVVLPLHAASEVTAFGGQYGLSPFLYAMGFGERTALEIGSLSYAAMLVAGCAVAVAIARRTADPAYIALAPPAFAIIGGTFLHIHQIAVALPLGLLLLARSGPRPLLVTAFVCLAIPWGTIAEIPSVAKHLEIAAPIPVASAKLPEPRANEVAEIPEMRLIRAGGFYDDRRTNAERLAIKLPTWFGLLVIAGYACGLATGRRRERVPGLATA